MTVLDDRTKIPLGWVLSLLGIVATGAVAGAFWIAGVNFELKDMRKSLTRIEKRLGIDKQESDIARIRFD